MPDVVVIGGGIVGASCAYELSRGGASVTVVERDELAAGASGRNQGWFVISCDPPLTPMSHISHSTYQEVIDSSPVPVRFDRDPIGHVMLASDETAVEALRERVDERAAAGVPVQRLGADMVREVEPALAPGLAEVWLLDQGRRIEPGALTVALALRAGELGADVRTHVAARALMEAGGRVSGVITDEGVLAADAVVLAAGPWSAALVRPLGLELPVTGARGWIVELAAPPGLIRHMVEEEGGDWGEDQTMPSAAELAGATHRQPGVSALLHQSLDNAIVCGASHHPAVGLEPEDIDAPARIIGRAIRVIPSIRDLPVREIRWGIRPMSPDGRPIVGWLREGLLIATGHGPEGILLGGGTGALVAAILAGDEPPFDHAPFSPARFLR